MTTKKYREDGMGQNEYKEFFLCWMETVLFIHLCNKTMSFWFPPLLLLVPQAPLHSDGPSPSSSHIILDGNNYREGKKLQKIKPA